MNQKFLRKMKSLMITIYCFLGKKLLNYLKFRL